MKTLLIGDIHGCYIEFQELLARVGIAESDAIIALGDIVDRGPETPQVLDFFRQQPDARSLMGNHERKHVRGAHGEVKLAMSQIIARGQFGETYGEALAFMQTFPTYLELPEAILVHGYLEPGLPLDQQRVTVLCGTMSGDRHLKASYDRPWYELYTGEKPVIVGHHDYLRNGQAFIYQERIFGLDTSCVHGKTLTGLVLPDFTIFSVPSRGDLWNVMRKQYRQLHPAARTSKPRVKKIYEPVLLDEESERILPEIIKRVQQENERVLARLRRQPDFENLTPRLQAKAYTTEIGNTPLAALLHLARRGELDAARVRRMIRNSTRADELRQIAPMTIPISECEICSQLAEIETSFSKYGWDDMTRSLPAAAGRLDAIKDVPSYDENNHFRRCPLCGVYYHYRFTYEYLVNGSEDEETLTRQTPTQVRAFLAQGGYERLVGFHRENLAHAAALARSYAAKCLVSHSLAQGELAAVEELLAQPDRDVIDGALSFLAALAWEGELPPEIAGLRTTLSHLTSNPDRQIADRTAYLLKYGLPGS